VSLSVFHGQVFLIFLLILFRLLKKMCFQSDWPQHLLWPSFPSRFKSMMTLRSLLTHEPNWITNWYWNVVTGKNITHLIGSFEFCLWLLFTVTVFLFFWFTVLSLDY